MRDKTENRLLFIDTETGGVDPQKHSLLSIALVVWDSSDGVIDSKEFFIKHNEYIITSEAKKINKFDIDKHELVALDAKSVIGDIRVFCAKFFPDDNLIPLAGHNTQFDVSFLRVFLESQGRSFNQLFSHRILDTYSIIMYLIYAEKIPPNVVSSAKVFQHFGIKVNGRHTALGDALATVKLFERLLEL